MQEIAQGSLPQTWTRAGTDDDAVDGVVPRWVATPRTVDELQATLAHARDGGLAVVAAGGATSLSLGNRPRSLDLVVCTRAMSSIVERNPEDMTVTVEAGATLAEVGRALATDGQRIALDVSSPELATIGGIVAAERSGGLAYGFGTPRDLVLGMSVVDGRARVLHVGGRVVKNVAGYDLVRLFAGSHGTLGIIARVTLRTHPLPEATLLCVCPFTDAATLDGVRAAIFRSELPLAAFDTEVDRANGREEWRLVLRLEGTPDEISYQRERCAVLAPGASFAEASSRRSPILMRDDEGACVRIGVLPDRAIAVARRLHEECSGDGIRIAARLGDGTLRVCARLGSDADAIAVVEAARRVAASEGTAVVERLPAHLKSDVDVWGAAPAGFALMREVKRRFDPDGILAPGRFVGGL